MSGQLKKVQNEFKLWILFFFFKVASPCCLPSFSVILIAHCLVIGYANRSLWALKLVWNGRNAICLNQG